MGNTMKYFTPWLNKSIIYKAKLSQSGTGIVYASEGTTFPCYISGEIIKTVNDKGEEIISTQQIYLNGETSGVSAIDFTGIVVIDSRNRPIKSINKFYDEDGDLDLMVLLL